MGGLVGETDTTAAAAANLICGLALVAAGDAPAAVATTAAVTVGCLYAERIHVKLVTMDSRGRVACAIHVSIDYAPELLHRQGTKHAFRPPRDAPLKHMS